MAKKRKKDKAEPEEYEFRPPEFNEKEFLKKELSDLRVGLITVVFAITLGVVAALISILSDGLVIVSFFIGIAGIAVLKQFYDILRIDTSEFKKKNWAGNIASFFFTFLAIWVLLLNMPFSDHASPVIENVIVWVNDGTKNMSLEYKLVETLGVYAWVSPDPDNYTADTLIHASASYTVNITARVTDNGKLSTVEISAIPYSGQYIPPGEMTAEPDHRFGFEVGGDRLGSTLTFNIVATDSEGNSSTFHPGISIPVNSP